MVTDVSAGQPLDVCDIEVLCVLDLVYEAKLHGLNQGTLKGLVVCCKMAPLDM